MNELDPSAKIYGWLDELHGGALSCTFTLGEVRGLAAEREGRRVVAWVDGKHVPVPDSLGEPQPVTHDEIMQKAANFEKGYVPLEGFWDRVREAGIDCGHRPLDRDEVLKVAEGWVRSTDLGSFATNTNDLTDRLVAAFGAPVCEHRPLTKDEVRNVIIEAARPYKEPDVQRAAAVDAVVAAFVDERPVSRVWTDEEITRLAKIARAARAQVTETQLGDWNFGGPTVRDAWVTAVRAVLSEIGEVTE